MKRSIIWILAIVAMLTALTACAPDSSPGVQVVGDNVARLEAGDTMVVHKGGKGARTWLITFDGSSLVTFKCEQVFCDDMEAYVYDYGQRVEADPGVFHGSFYVSLRSDEAVDVEWPWGLAIQLPD